MEEKKQLEEKNKTKSRFLTAFAQTLQKKEKTKSRFLLLFAQTVQKSKENEKNNWTVLGGVGRTAKK